MENKLPGPSKGYKKQMRKDGQIPSCGQNGKQAIAWLHAKQLIKC
jgi:hypothetical protein